MFDPSDISQDEIMRLRKAAKAAWSDDTRRDSLRGHPMKEFGQCYVTAAWLVSRLGGYVGQKGGHFFWVSPDKKYALDLVNDDYAFEPSDNPHEGMMVDEHDIGGFKIPESRKVWHPGPPVYKSTSHHLFDGMRIKDREHKGERTLKFIKRANAVYESL